MCCCHRMSDIDAKIIADLLRKERQLTLRIAELELAIVEIHTGACNQTAHGGMSWIDVKKICSRVGPF